MRTAPMALAYLSDDDALADVASANSQLTQYDPVATQACM
jgi:hypothetical protein